MKRDDQLSFLLLISTALYLGAHVATALWQAVAPAVASAMPR